VLAELTAWGVDHDRDFIIGQGVQNVRTAFMQLFDFGTPDSVLL